MNSDTRKNILHVEDYIVDVAPQKNRVYVTITGKKREPSDPLQLMERVHDLIDHVSGDFTVLLAVNHEHVHSRKAILFVRSLQEMLVEGGMFKIAEILPDSNVIRRHYERIATKTGTLGRRKVFRSYEDAEAWLDSQAVYSIS